LIDLHRKVTEITQKFRSAPCRRFLRFAIVMLIKCECSSRCEVRFKKSTAHSRDVLELNLRWLSGWLPEAESHLRFKRVSAREACRTVDAAGATRGVRTSTPQSPACMAGTSRV